MAARKGGKSSPDKVVKKESKTREKGINKIIKQDLNRKKQSKAVK